MATETVTTGGIPLLYDVGGEGPPLYPSTAASTRRCTGKPWSRYSSIGTAPASNGYFRNCLVDGLSKGRLVESRPRVRADDEAVLRQVALVFV